MRKIRLLPFGVGLLTTSYPLISFDSKYLFTLGDECVYVWIVETGECHRQLVQPIEKTCSSKLIGSKMVSMALNPHNRLQLCVGQDSGSIDIWDYEDGIRIQRIEHGQEIHSIYSISNRSLIVFGKNYKNVICLYSYENLRNPCEGKLIFDKLISNPKSISFDENGRFCCFIGQDGKQIYLLNFSTKQLKCFQLNKSLISSNDKIIVCQLHPRDQCLAIGCHSGRILLWFDYIDQQQNEQRKISYLHWHSLPVLSLNFSSDGSYLLSGGHESVLVKWLYKSQEPTFRPRLGSPINSIVCSLDQQLIVTMHEDNCLHLIGSHLSIRQTIAGFNRIQSKGNRSFSPELKLFARQKSIVTNSGKSGHLQFISIENGKLLDQLDIVGENYVSPSELTNDYHQSTEIKQFSFDRGDNWLATYEERLTRKSTNEDDQTEGKLRFWWFIETENNQRFELNTTITYPHGEKTLNKLLFHPSKNQLATSGDDGFVKIWILVEKNLLRSGYSYWRCLSALSYRSYRSESICYYKMSQFDLTSEFDDQWFIACSFKHIVNIWIDQSKIDEQESLYQYSMCLAHFDRNDFVTSICQDSEKMLIVHKNLVNLWNCRTGEYLKSFHWNVHSICQSRFSSFVALFEKNFVHIYSFIDGKCQTRKEQKLRQVRSSIFINERSNSPFEKSNLIVSIDDQGLKMLVEDKSDEINRTLEFEQIDSINENDCSLAKLIIESKSDQSLKRKRSLIDESISIDRSSRTFENQLISTACYLLPSIDRYTIESLKKILIPSTKSIDR